MSAPLDNRSLAIGFALGVFGVAVVLPASAWTLLRVSEPMRRRTFNKVADVVDRTAVSQVGKFSGDVGNVIRSVAIPAVEVATGQRWTVFLHENGSAPVANAVLELAALPPVSV